jgi:hypothetical protein
LAEHSPTVTYHIDGQEIQIKNQVSADNYEKYNEIHGTLYLPEPKLGTGKQNETVEYLAEIQKIREHNAKERELEQRQKHFDQQHEYFHSCSNEPFSSPEVMHYLNHLIKKATTKKNWATISTKLFKPSNRSCITKNGISIPSIIISTTLGYTQNRTWNLKSYPYGQNQ